MSELQSANSPSETVLLLTAAPDISENNMQHFPEPIQLQTIIPTHILPTETCDNIITEVNNKRKRVADLETDIQYQVSLMLQKIACSLQNGGIEVTNCMMCHAQMEADETTNQFNLCLKCFKFIEP
jgi:hypothetical protein